MIERSFYIYLHRRDDTGAIFYVGKGTRTKKHQYQRAYELSSRNILWKRIANKTNYTVEIVADFFDEKHCFDMERELIALYGKRANGGTLCNMTDGGEGHVGLEKTAETIEKLRAASSGSRHPNFGKKLSAETCRKKSESMKASDKNLKGKTLPDWWKKKIAETNHGALIPMYGKTGAAHHNSRKVKDVETGTMYESMTAAANAIGMKVGTLYNMLKGTNPNRTSLEFA